MTEPFPIHCPKSAGKKFGPETLCDPCHLLPQDRVELDKIKMNFSAISKRFQDFRLRLVDLLVKKKGFTRFYIYVYIKCSNVLLTF